ncbi:hypothetical protein M3A49_07180 [Paraburkholderia sp. CNPSo 3076]|uniref:hypothetical protein n=1 Tax=Paraburkholderia sp. CNPSo 3076 TaxID=2940936 RepID=UPI0022566540|nr:hypothetical protein [Paraburkholderia sp. CNPSo 3076]MCX5539279.1 hypothetical protein [Paraburkholderia sp. CNPSo 3076]
MASGKYRGVNRTSQTYSCFCNKALAQYANRRIGADLARRGFLIGMGATMPCTGCSPGEGECRDSLQCTLAIVAAWVAALIS